LDQVEYRRDYRSVGGRFRLGNYTGWISLTNIDELSAEFSLRQFATDKFWIIERTFNQLCDHSGEIYAPNVTFSDEELRSRGLKYVIVKLHQPLEGSNRYYAADIEVTSIIGSREYVQTAVLTKQY